MRVFMIVLAIFGGLISGVPLVTSPTDGVRGYAITATVVSGTVTDASSGAPLMGARIHVEGLTLSVLAANNGRYRLTIPASAGFPASARSEIVIRADLIGYASSTKTVSLGAQSLRVDFALHSSAPSESPDDRNGAAAIGGAVEADAERMRITADAVSVAFALPRALNENARRVDAQQRRRGQTYSELQPPGQRLPGRYNPNFQREGYDRIYENEFMAVGANPLSTFGIDVDRASYSNVRRFIRSGQLPPADAVRIEELINYFTYDLPNPEGPDPFLVQTEVGPAPWNPMHRLVRIGIQGRRINTADLPPSNLVFLVDVSGSMQPANKLPLLKSALGMLVNQLRPQDRVAIVVYAGAAGLVLEPTSGADKEAILEALTRLEAGGSTAGGAGLRLAYDVARKHHMEGGNNRVILASDGDFNVGPSSDAEMIRLIEERRDEGTFLTVLGFGTGNLQDAKMEQIADHGNGNFAYIDSVHEAQKVLVQEFGGTLYTIAKDVKIQVEFNPAHVKAYRLIGYENRMLAAEDFNDDRKDSGDLGAGHTVTALYEVIPTGVDSGTAIRGLDELRYQRTDERVSLRESSEMLFVKLRYKDPDGSRSRLLSHAVRDTDVDFDVAPSSDFTFAASVAAFGMVLRDSEYRGAADLAAVLRWARSSVGPDHEGYRKEFVRMVEEAQRLADRS
ncbi:MAG: von Willebrand factor type A domain-containing protein [Gemmatimonadetes bacterium]|nr:von Willebrand factor type A domain-containing protein [Gemmatimonadota bacterium]